MNLTRSQLYLAVGAVAVAAILVTAGLWVVFLSNDDEGEELDNVKEMAEFFAENYDGGFNGIPENFALTEDSTDNNAVVYIESGNTMLPYYKIHFEAVSDAESRFNALKTELEDAMPVNHPMNSTPREEVTTTQEFVGFVSYKYDVSIGGQTFTLLCFAAYIDGVVVYADYEAALYYPGVNVSEETAFLFEAVFCSLKLTPFTNPIEVPYVGSDVLGMAEYMKDNYSGIFGTSAVSTDSTEGSATMEFDGEGMGGPTKYYVTYESVADAEALFNDKKAAFESLTPIMGASPTEVTGIAGFDGFKAYKYDVNMVAGLQTVKFTKVQFVGYLGDTVVYSDDGLLYYGNNATEAEVAELFQAVYNSIMLTDISGVADTFNNKYIMPFGHFTVAEGSTASSAVLECATGQSMMDISKIYYETSASAQALFNEKVTELDGLQPMMGTRPTEITGIAGFDGFAAYKYDVSIMGQNFTIVCFAGYVDDVVVYSTSRTAGLLHYGEFATDVMITEVFDSILGSIDNGGNVSSMAGKMAKDYVMPFGTFTVLDGSTKTDLILEYVISGGMTLSTKIYYKSSSSAEALFDEKRVELESLTGFMNATPVEITGITGFDGFKAYKIDVNAYGQTFTMICFAGYVDDILVYTIAKTGPVQFGSISTNDTISELFGAISASITV